MATKTSIWNNPQFRAILFQAVLSVALIALVVYLVSNTLYNLETRGIPTGFQFLDQKSGFDILQSLISYDSDSTYGRTFLVGIINTILVSTISIFFATIIGFIVGISRLSKNWLIAKVAKIYIEIFRNIPLLLQILFWYSILTTTLPRILDSVNFADIIYLNNRGFFMPEPITEPGFSLVWLALGLAGILSFAIRRWAKKRQEISGQSFPTILVIIALLFGLPLITLLIQGIPLHFEYPVKGRFNFTGGMVFIPELAAMVIALSVYTAAFIAEIVRSGILSVNTGQKEAAKSIALKPNKILSLVIVPQAMRVIIPQLTSQFLNLTKNSSLATAVGYPELTAVFMGTTLNQTGQAIEIVAMTMAVYLTLSLTISAFMNWYNSRSKLTER